MTVPHQRRPRRTCDAALPRRAVARAHNGRRCCFRVEQCEAVGRHAAGAYRRLVGADLQVLDDRAALVGRQLGPDDAALVLRVGWLAIVERDVPLPELVPDVAIARQTVSSTNPPAVPAGRSVT